MNSAYFKMPLVSDLYLIFKLQFILNIRPILDVTYYQSVSTTTQFSKTKSLRTFMKGLDSSKTNICI